MTANRGTDGKEPVKLDYASPDTTDPDRPKSRARRLMLLAGSATYALFAILCVVLGVTERSSMEFVQVVAISILAAILAVISVMAFRQMRE
jgi:hypothetical protein